MEEDLQLMNELSLLIGQNSSDLSAIALIDQNNRIKWKYMFGNRNERYRHMITKPGLGITGQVFRFGRMIIIDQMHLITEQTRLQSPIMQSELLLSVIAVPLYNEHRIFGSLLIGDRQLRSYSDDDIQHVKQASERLIAMMPKEQIQAGR